MRLYSADLPAASVIVRDGVPHVSVEGAEAGTWKAAGNHVQARKWGLEYLAAAQAMEQWQNSQKDAERARDRRRDRPAHVGTLTAAQLADLDPHDKQAREAAEQ